MHTRLTRALLRARVVAGGVVRRAEEAAMCLPNETTAAMLRVASLDEAMLKEEFTVRCNR